MASCKIIADNGQLSALHQRLFRYYREAGLEDTKANNFAVADWVRTKANSFKQAFTNLVTDPNKEPELYYNGKPLTENTMEELHQGLEADRTPVYHQVVEGSVRDVSAVRAKPSILGYEAGKNNFKPADDIKTFGLALSTRFGVPLHWVTREQALSFPGYSGQASFMNDGVAYAIEGQATPAHLAHEVFGHPLLEMLEQQKPHVYSALINEAMGHKDLADMVRQQYPHEIKANGSFTEEAKKEVVLKALEMEVNNLLDKHAPGFKAFIRRMWEALKDVLHLRPSDTLNSKTTVADLARMVMGTDVMTLGIFAPKGFHASQTGSTEVTNIEYAAQVRKNGNLDGRITFNDFGLAGGEYKDSKDTKKKIQRTSEAVEHYFLGRMAERNYEEEAENKAKRIFRNTFGNISIDESDTTHKVQLAQFNSKPMTFKQLKYAFLKNGNDARKHGKIGHLLIQMLFDPDPLLAKRLTALQAKQVLTSDPTIEVSSYMDAYKKFDYLYGDPDDADDKGAMEDIKRLIGYDLDKDMQVLTEHLIYDEEWNIGRTADMTLIASDNERISIDFKFGDIEGGVSNEIMKYLNIAKMGSAKASRLNSGIMAQLLGHVMEKRKDPSAKWKAIKILSVRKGEVAADIVDSYDLQDYLDGIKEWAKVNHPSTFKQDLAAGLYDIDNYFGETLEMYRMRREGEMKAADIKDADKYKEATDPVKVQAALMDKLVMLNTRLESLKQKGSKQPLNELEQELYEETIKSMQLMTRTIQPQKIEARGDDLINKLISDTYNHYDVSVNIAVALKDRYTEATSEVTHRQAQREAVMEQFMSNLRASKGVSNPKLLGLNVSVGGIPYYKKGGGGLWNAMWVEEPSESGKEGMVMRIISKTRDKAKWDALSGAEREMLDYMLPEMERQYNKAMGRMVTTSTGKKMTKAEALGLPKRWDPEHAMAFLELAEGEQAERDKGLADTLKRFGKGVFGGFIRDEYQPNTKEHFGLPVKYMTLPDDLRIAQAHSLNGEHVFMRFMEHMDHLEMMEDVYAQARGVQIALQQYQREGKSYGNLERYIDKTIERTILGRNEGEDIKLGRFKTEDGKAKYFSFMGVLEKARMLTTYSTLTFQPVLAGLNMALITSINYKTAALNSLLKVAGVKDVAFDIGNMTKGYGDYLKLQKDIQAGTYQDNKLYHMLKEWKWTPENYNFTTIKKNMGYVRNGLLDEGHLLFLHTMVENSGNISILAALARSMKVKAGDKEMSVWDAYDVKSVKDEASGKTIKTLNWKVGVRGFIKLADSRKVPLTGLTPPEVEAFKKTSARITGDYRQSEHSAADMSAAWKLGMQFRRYLFRYAKNMLEGNKLDSTLGKYIDSGEVDVQEDGSKIPILKWERTITEGWARTMVNGIMCAALYYNVPVFRKMATFFGMGNIDEFIEKYRWSGLSDFQKANVARASLNFLLLTLSIAAAYGIKQEPDDALLKSRLKRLLDDMTEGGNAVDLMNAVVTPFPSIVKLKNLVQYGTEFMVSSITDERTQEGILKGQRNFTRQFGPLAAAQQIQNIAEGK